MEEKEKIIKELEENFENMEICNEKLKEFKKIMDIVGEDE